MITANGKTYRNYEAYTNELYPKPSRMGLKLDATALREKERAFAMRDSASHCLRASVGISQGAEVDPASAGVTLMGPATWADGTQKKLVWVKLATPGVFKGHNSGEFELSSKVFDEIVRNFNERALPVQFDWEHVSEGDPSQGSIPEQGTPAAAWAHKLENRGANGLWGLTEFLDKARGQIKAGEYAYVSPAIRYGCRHPVTGKEIGARLSSVALTNSPFLQNLGRLAAATSRGA